MLPGGSLNDQVAKPLKREEITNLLRLQGDDHTSGTLMVKKQHNHGSILVGRIALVLSQVETKL